MEFVGFGPGRRTLFLAELFKTNTQVPQNTHKNSHVQ